MNKIFLFLFLFNFNLLFSGIEKYNVDLDYKVFQMSMDILNLQVGVVEQPNKSNWGPEVSQYLKSVNINKGASWCAALQYYAFDKAFTHYNMDIKKDFPFNSWRAASAQYWFNRAREIGEKTNEDIKRGDLIVWKKGRTAYGHIERIDKILNNGWLMTIGGNTSSGDNGSQRNGDGVYYRKRHFRNAIGQLLVKGYVGWNLKNQIKPEDILNNFRSNGEK